MIPSIEPERYELLAGPAYNFSFGRRSFFKTLGGGLVVVSYLAKAQESGSGRGRFGRAMPKEIAAWLHIDDKGAVTVYTGKVEVGQNSRTSLTMSVAEELGAPLTSIELVMGDTERTPFDMGTFGSMTTPQMVPQLRRVAAAARQLLPDQPWEKINFAEVAKNPALAKAETGAVQFKATADWKVLGTSPHKVNGRDFVTGRHRYASDGKLPGMLYGRILRPDRFEASLVSLNSSAAEKMSGVTVVHDGDFVGVAAPRLRDAEHALAALHAEWKTSPQPSSRELFDYLKHNVEEGSARGDRSDRHDTGSVESALAQAAHRIEETYTVSYIAHAPLEPRAALAEWKDGSLTVWTGTQRPFAVRDELAAAFHLPADRVRVIVPDTGAAYGGKHTGETAVEAARLARAAGHPVSLLWTRQEEFTWAYFRPAGVIEIKSGVTQDGKLAAWEFHNYNSGGSGIGTPYVVENQRIEYHPVRSPLRQGSYRGLAATANHFARESHMDVLAHATGVDPLEFRLKNLTDARLRAVFEAAAKSFGWPRKRERSGQGFGIGGGVEKGGYLATCAEVAVDRTSGSVRVVRVATAFECGAIVNPDGLRNQVMGATIMGLGGALFEAVEFDNGRITNPLFSLYRVPRFKDVPELEVVLLDRKDLPSAGAGETPIVGLAPAIGNAIFDATGVRLRSLPMVPNGLKI